MDKDILYFIFGVIVMSFIYWVIGAFICWDLKWFLNSMGGRIMAIILFIASIAGTAKSLD